MLNPCIECGKERVDGKSWKEKNGSSIIVHTSTVCPDPTCQKIVDKAMEDRRAKSAMLIQKKLDNKLLREKALAAN